MSEDLLPATHMAGKLVLAVDGRGSFLSMLSFSQGCLSILIGWLLVFPGASNPEEVEWGKEKGRRERGTGRGGGKGEKSFYNLALAIT